MSEKKKQWTRINPFKCEACGAESDGGIKISVTAHYPSAYDTLDTPVEREICDVCFETIILLKKHRLFLAKQPLPSESVWAKMKEKT